MPPGLLELQQVESQVAQVAMLCLVRMRGGRNDVCGLDILTGCGSNGFILNNMLRQAFKHIDESRRCS